MFPTMIRDATKHGHSQAGLRPETRAVSSRSTAQTSQRADAISASQWCCIHAQVPSRIGADEFVHGRGADADHLPNDGAFELALVPLIVVTRPRNQVMACERFFAAANRAITDGSEVGH